MTHHTVIVIEGILICT